MQIEWVNHASFILDAEGVRLISDPWLDGAVFHEGWKHLSETQMPYQAFDSITHIWFSHEHPDHFFPPNLKKIPEAARAKITILFQETKDKKVIGFCKKLGFKKIVELPKNNWFAVNDKVKVLNRPFLDGDSWMCIDVDGYKILNLNDCIVYNDKYAQAIYKWTGTVDLMLTQFSYANWQGNPEDLKFRQDSAAEKVGRIAVQAKAFQPKYIIPFASFVWFCHEENYYLNDAVVTVSRAKNFIDERTSAEPVVLYPGQTWTIGEAHDPTLALERYATDEEQVTKNPTLTPTQSISKADLAAAAITFLDKTRQANGRLIRMIPATKIYISDHKQAYELSYSKGFKPIAANYEQCDISLTADALNYCFKFLWGGATIKIGGRLRVPAGGNFKRFNMLFRVSNLNNQGKTFNLSYAIRLAFAKLLKIEME